MVKVIEYAVVVAFLFSNPLKAQSSLEEDIIGDWRVVAIHDVGATIPKDFKQHVEVLRKAFQGAKFYFKADNTFSLDISLKEMEIKNAHWKVDEYTNEVIIQEWKDREKIKPVLMGMNVLVKEEKTIFKIEETFLAFEVERDPN